MTGLSGFLSLAEPYSKLEAMRWIFCPIDFFDFNRTQIIAAGIAPSIVGLLWKLETAACDIVLQLTKIAVRAARDLVLLGHLNTIKAAEQDDERWIKCMLGSAIVIGIVSCKGLIEWTRTSSATFLCEATPKLR